MLLSSRKLRTSVFTRSAHAEFPTRGRPKTTESTSTSSGSAIRSITASRLATAAPKEWPVTKTFLNPFDASEL